MKTLFLTLLLFICALSANAQCTYANPIVGGNFPDPWILQKDGWYYWCKQDYGNQITVERSRNLPGITPTEGWTRVYSTPYGGVHEAVWAPELHFFNGKWYIYSSGDLNPAPGLQDLRMFVLESNNWNGPYEFKGFLNTRDFRPEWSIDPNILVHPNGKIYISWSQWEGAKQCIYLGELSSPWQINRCRKLSTPDLHWEVLPYGDRFVNEGPQFLIKNNKLHIAYSASQCHSRYYCLGLLTTDLHADIMTSFWAKSNTPVFTEGNGVYGPGHNCFVKSPNGAEDWIVYHAHRHPWEDDAEHGDRDMHAQKFSWNGDFPVFGPPIGFGVWRECPADGPVVTPSTESLPSQFESFNFPGHFIRHYGYRGRIDTNVNPLADAQFKIVAGLAIGNAVSFESVNFPGYFLRHRDGQIWLDPNNGSELFKADATWWRRPGLANSEAVSYETYNFPGSFIRHSNYLLFSQPINNDIDRRDATFWERNLTHGAIYKIINRNSGQCLDVAGGSNVNGANIGQWPDNGATAQQWRAINAGNGNFVLEALCSNKCMDVEGFSLANGANISQYTTNFTSNQLWKVYGVADGFFKLVNRNSGKVADVEGFSLANGANVSQYTDNNTTNQHWRFVQIFGAQNEMVETGIEQFANDQLSIFPNPASNTITVQATASYPDARLCLFDINGKKLREITTWPNNSEVNISDLKKGIYIIQVQSMTGVVHKKLLVK